MFRLHVYIIIFLLPVQILAFKLTNKKLDNGLEVLFVESHSVPLVTVKIVVRNGAFTESEEYNGLSHLYEHMFFKANKNLPSEEQRSKFTRANGIYDNGSTAHEFVDYYFIMHKKNLQKGLVLMYDSLIYPVFDEVEFKKEKGVVLSEYDDRVEASNEGYFRKEFTKATYGKYASYRDIIGDRKIVETATREKMLNIKNRFYVPNNSLLIIAGDIDPGKTFEDVKKIFSPWKGSKDFFDKQLPAIPTLKKTKTFIVNRDVNIARIRILFNGPGVATAINDTYSADLLSFVLGHLNSKFNRELVESGITQGSSFGYYTLSKLGEITFNLSLRAENLKKAMKILSRQIKEMNDLETYIDKNLLEESINLLEIEKLYTRESASLLVNEIGFWWSVADINYYFNYIDNIKKVGISDLQNFFNKYIKNRPFVGGVMISKKDQKKYEIDTKIFEEVFK